MFTGKRWKKYRNSLYTSCTIFCAAVLLLVTSKRDIGSDNDGTKNGTTKTLSCSEVYIGIHGDTERSLNLAQDFIHSMRGNFAGIPKEKQGGYRFTIDIVNKEGNIIEIFSNYKPDNNVFFNAQKHAMEKTKFVRQYPLKNSGNKSLVDLFFKVNKLLVESELPEELHAYIFTELTEKELTKNPNLENDIISVLSDIKKDLDSHNKKLTLYLLGVEEERSSAVRILHPLSEQSNSSGFINTEWKPYTSSFIDQDCQ